MFDQPDLFASLCLADVALRRGNRTLFTGFDLIVSAGEVVSLTGPNGSGKTSLLRAIAGLCPVTAGRIDFLGPAGVLDAEVVRAGQMHFIGHLEGLKAANRLREELAFQQRWLGGTASGLAQAIEVLDLQPLLDLEIRRLSAGQKRRAGMARLLLAPRRLWLLDEPLAPLDQTRRDLFGRLMHDHVAGGGMILAAVHDRLPVASRVQEIGR